MKISVIMPAYNAAKYIREAIESILRQTYSNFELLVCDDASDDSTYEIAKSYNDKRIVVFRNRTNKKKPKTVNWLFTNSTGDIITIHDADDISLATRFESIIKVFKDQPNISMCGHSIQRITENGRPIQLYRWKVTDFENIKMGMQSYNTDGDASLFIRREVLTDLGEIFRPYFKNNMDYDLALRIIEKYESTNLPEVLLYYRNVPNSISKGVFTYHKLITEQVTKALASERKNIGLDALQRGDLKEISEPEEKFSSLYRNDRTLHFRKMASFFMYCKMNKEAIRYMFMAVIEEPNKLENWRTLQYCIRKTILGI